MYSSFIRLSSCINDYRTKCPPNENEEFINYLDKATVKIIIKIILCVKPVQGMRQRPSGSKHFTIERIHAGSLLHLTVSAGVIKLQRDVYFGQPAHRQLLYNKSYNWLSTPSGVSCMLSSTKERKSIFRTFIIYTENKNVSYISNLSH